VVALAALAVGCGSAYSAVDGHSSDQREKTETDEPAPEPSTTAAMTEGAVLDAGTPAPCATQTVAWTPAGGGSTCTANADALADGEAKTLTASESDRTGKVTVTCSQGRLALSGATCASPTTFDVNSATGCINGYCKAVLSGNCGTPDPAKAAAFCIFKGFTAATTFTTRDGPNGVRQCSPDGTGCFVNANPSCNIVFASVTCR
jgi:hypothetical protein